MCLRGQRQRTHTSKVNKGVDNSRSGTQWSSQAQYDKQGQVYEAVSSSTIIFLRRNRTWKRNEHCLFQKEARPLYDLIALATGAKYSLENEHYESTIYSLTTHAPCAAQATQRPPCL